MPERFQVIEKIAFSFVCLAAAMCSAFIAYEQSPDVRVGLHAGKELVIKSGQYSYGCAAAVSDPCAQFPIQ
ncbi:MAG TPA: hypothetical protein VGG24_18635 [Paraburkholderia sp.]|jgi:hypothetical protein